MSDTDINQQDDTDVLRAQDIVPPYNKEKLRAQDLPITESGRKKNISSQDVQKQTFKEATPSLSASRPQHAETSATEIGDVVKEVNEIPKFDLAEQIMAEQRKITAIRRKAPGQKTKAPDRQPRIESTCSAIRQPAPKLSEKGLIIAEIVARDIEKLYRGDSSSLRTW